MQHNIIYMKRLMNINRRLVKQVMANNNMYTVILYGHLMERADLYQ